jgi:membrane protein YqaA with SNARE-associated domain
MVATMALAFSPVATISDTVTVFAGTFELCHLAYISFAQIAHEGSNEHTTH